MTSVNMVIFSGSSHFRVTANKRCLQTFVRILLLIQGLKNMRKKRNLIFDRPWQQTVKKSHWYFRSRDLLPLHLYDASIRFKHFKDLLFYFYQDKKINYGEQFWRSCQILKSVILMKAQECRLWLKIWWKRKPYLNQVTSRLTNKYNTSSPLSFWFLGCNYTVSILSMKNISHLHRAVQCLPIIDVMSSLFQLIS